MSHKFSYVTNQKKRENGSISLSLVTVLERWMGHNQLVAKNWHKL